MSGKLALQLPRLHRRAVALAVLGAAGLLTPFASAALEGRAPTLAWALDLAAHWQWLFLAALLLGGAVAVSARPRWAALLAFAPLLWLGAAPEAARAPAGGAALTLISANVHVGNPDPSPLATWIAAERPELVALVEASGDYAERLDPALAYPHRVLRPRDDPFGVALLSRHPIVEAGVVEEPDGVQRIEAVVDWQGQRVTVVVFHPMPPIRPQDHAARNAALAQLARAYHDRPTIVAGDFNATPWSSALALPAEAGFRLVGGKTPSWPAAGGGWFGIPIDHVLVSRHWRAVAHRLGPDIGSDHLPVLVQLAAADGLAR